MSDWLIFKERIGAELNAELVGDVVEVLVQADDGRRSAHTSFVREERATVAWCTCP